MFCSKCGGENDDSSAFCHRCGAALSAAQEPPAKVASAVVQVAYGGPGTGTTRIAAAGSKALAVDKNPAVAVILSIFIIGAGQLYNGDPKKAALMFIGAIILAIPTAGFAVLGFWIWSAMDAYQVASRKWAPW